MHFICVSVPRQVGICAKQGLRNANYFGAQSKDCATNSNNAHLDLRKVSMNLVFPTDTLVLFGTALSELF